MNDNSGVIEARGEAPSLTSALRDRLAQDIAAAAGWIGFDRYMETVLYAPGLGYYANDLRKFGAMPESGSDFVTAPEMTPLFGQCLAVQLGQALRETETGELWEFGAGSGALALQLLQGLGHQVRSYTIVELSGSLRQRQQALLSEYRDKLRWVDRLPDQISAVVIGNELLDAMPLKLLARQSGFWQERGVGLTDGQLVWRDRPTALRPPFEVAGEHDYLTEIHPVAEGFMRSLGDRLQRGAAFFIDYGFPEHEYYHPQRAGGTLMCHRSHRADAEPLADPGMKDITTHINFTGIALAAQEVGLECLGYTSQGRFLLNCGMADLLAAASLAERTRAQRLIHEHEMGELFKVIGFRRAQELGPEGVALDRWDAVGFTAGDRTHRL